MAHVTIEKAAKLTGKHRSTIARHIKSGKLSKTDKGIDTAELIRVYGELVNENKSRNDVKQDDSLSQREKFLMQQVEALHQDIKELKDTAKQDRELSREREQWLKELIDTKLPAPDKKRFGFW